MTVNPFIRALSLAGFEAFAARQGLDPARLLRAASLPPTSLRRPEDILSFRRYCTLLELCRRSSDNPLFGLAFGLYQGVDVFGDMFHLIYNSTTVGDALLELRANYEFYNGAAQIDLEIVDGQAFLGYRAGEQAIRGLAQAEELACGVGLRLMQTLAGAGWRPKAVLLRHTPLGNASGYRQALGLLPTFATAHTGLLFDASVLALPLSLANETLHRLMAEHLSGLERLAADEMPGYVRQLLRNLLPSGRATVERVADCMAMTPRTLQRRLSQEGTSFQRLLDETRQGLAQHYLKTASISMTHMAQLLGYADVSTFSRAFNRWFGMSPLEHQKQLGLRRQPFRLQGRMNDRQGRR